MAIKYLKKSPKTPSTDDSKTTEIVKGLLKEIEISKIAVKDLNKKRDIELDNNLLTDDPFKLINDPSIDVIVEVMGGLDLAKDIILQSLKLG